MSANTEAPGSGRGLETAKWLIVAVLLVVAIVGNYYYREYSLPLRVGSCSNYRCCRCCCIDDSKR